MATGCTIDQLLATEAKQPPVAAPGARWSYTNYGYNGAIRDRSWCQTG